MEILLMNLDVNFSVDDRALMIDLEGKKDVVLKKEENFWRLKSRAIWMVSGDDNTKLFQAFMKGRKQQNMIWEIKNDRHEQVSTFEYLVETSKSFYEPSLKLSNKIRMLKLFRFQIISWKNL